jgi:ribosomal protein S8
MPRILEKRFRENKGLGNEIGYYIFDYDPKDELLVREHIEFIKQRVNSNNSEVEIKEFDLYELMIEVLEQKGYLQKVMEMEAKKGSEKILTPIKKTLRLTQKNDLIIDYIKKNVSKNNIVFLTGVGKAWPVIRSHTVLNNLHSAIDDVPVVMFFPGRYDGQELCLFDEIKDDNYYRAFKLVER